MSWRKILEEQGIAPRYLQCDFSAHPAIKPRGSKITEYASNPKGNLLMTGPCGTGKTMTAIAIMALNTHLKGRGARFYNSEGLYSNWLWEARHGHPGGLQERLSACPLLILDDLGQGQVSDAYLRWLYSIINKRWEWERPTVITTNLNSKKFRDLFGEAILSRISNGQVWAFEGVDHRTGRTHKKKE